MAEQALRALDRDRASQSFVISGESGSGKTESSKIVMKYLAMCGQPTKKGSTEERRASAQLNSLSEKVLSCNPILEAFGNATQLGIPWTSEYADLTTTFKTLLRAMLGDFSTDFAYATHSSSAELLAGLDISS